MNNLPGNLKIFIPGNVPSSKNSKQWTGKYLVSSKSTAKYVKASVLYWQKYQKRFLKMIEGKEKPYKIGLYFIRDSHRRFDLINAAQLPCDLMVKNEWIDDDNASEIIPVFLGFEVDKINAGIIITILDN